MAALSSTGTDSSGWGFEEDREDDWQHGAGHEDEPEAYKHH